jgi:membrane dipeptidase
MAAKRISLRFGAPLNDGIPTMTNGLTRRSLLHAALPALVLGPLAARGADLQVPIADMHSHFGIITRPTLPSAEFADELRAHRVALIVWALPSDLRWIRAVSTGIEQAREPVPGDLSAFFRERLGRMKAYVDRSGLRPVLASGDVDACLAGDSGVVLACEGADFLEGRVEGLGSFHAQGLRHLQLVHYIRNPIGDFQTVPPVHHGLSEVGKRLVEACNEHGILVDLAHCSAAAVDQALEIAKRPVVWSHSWVDQTGGRWQDRYGYLQRRLSLAQARKIADRGGVVGLWGLALTRPGPSSRPGQGNWTVARGDVRAYAAEIANLVDWLGAEHVGIGTDIEGMGAGWSVNDYGHVRSVVETLLEMKLPTGTVEKVACGNYARVLKAALKG